MKKLLIGLILGTMLGTGGILANQVETEVGYGEIEVFVSNSEMLEPELTTLSKEELFEQEFMYLAEIPLSKDVQKFIYDESKRITLNYIDVLSLISTETDFRPNLVHHNTNGTTDYGLFQVNSCNFPKMAKDLGICGDYLNIHNNVKMGIHELSDIISKWECTDYDQHLIDVLSSYNKGYTGYKKYGPATKYISRFNEKKQIILNMIN